MEQQDNDRKRVCVTLRRQSTLTIVLAFLIFHASELSLLGAGSLLLAVAYSIGQDQGQELSQELSRLEERVERIQRHNEHQWTMIEGDSLVGNHI